MSSVSTFGSQASEERKRHEKLGSSSESQNNNDLVEDPSSKKINALEAAWFVILQSMLIGRKVAQTQAKEMENNAFEQGQLIAQESKQNFITFNKDQLYHRQTDEHKDQHWSWDLWNHTGCFLVFNQWNTYKTVLKDGAAEDLKMAEAKNQDTNGTRQVLTERISGLRQDGQNLETNASVTINDCEENMQKAASVMQMIGSLTNQIARG